MRWAITIVGVVSILLGGLWILQGINVIPIGFMAGHPEYALLGAVVAIAGIGLLVLSRRRRSNVNVGGPDRDHEG